MRGTLAYREARAVVKRIIRSSKRERVSAPVTVSHSRQWPPSIEIGRPSRSLGFERPRYDPLLDAWKEEKRVERRVNRYCSFRINLGGRACWQLYSGVQLLYCSRLLDDKLQEEEDALADVLGADERRDVIRLGKEAVATGQMPALGRDTTAVLERLCSSAFFNKEPPFRGVLLERVGQLRKRDRKWDGLHKQLIEIYTDRPAYPWREWSLQERQYEGDFGKNFDAFVNGVVDWKACLEAIRSCPVLRELLTGRPPKSILPHPYALMECTEHVLLWMAQSKVPVDTGFLTTYREMHPLPPPELVNDLAKRYKSEIMPKQLLGELRREFFMDCMGIKFHDQFGTVSCARDLYVKHGADPTRLPRPGKVLVKPMEDASGPEKMSHWFYTPGLIHLHRDLLSRTGFEDEYGYYSDSWSSDDEQDEE